MTVILEATDIRRTFVRGDVANPVLHGASLTVRAGEFVTIMGPSGSGKSTLLYCLCGMDVVDSGEVRLGDVRLAELSEEERTELRGRRMGFVFQDANLIDALTVLDNILLPSSLQGTAEPDVLRARALELMELTGIAGLEGRAVSEVSGGQRQRVSLCRALLGDPGLLFGDEPTGALNSTASREVTGLLREFSARGTAMLVATHDPRVSAQADRVVFLADGVVIDELVLAADGSLEEREASVLEAMARLGI